MLLDTLETCRAQIVDVGVLYSRPEERESLAALVGPGVPLVLQHGQGLSAALHSGARTALERRDAVVLVSSDIPGVPPGSLIEAVDRLSRDADVVLGPGFDGGYWLVGLNEAHVEPFENIPWSTEAVLQTTVDRCQTAGLAVAFIEAWRDIDRPEDVTELIPDLDRLPGRRTAALLRALTLIARPDGPIRSNARIKEVSQP
jgi:glycosyltransferase A (GT-A) superfamily protein (DUF2064 family)